MAFSGFGDWKLESIVDGEGASVNIPGGRPLKLMLSKPPKGDGIRLQFKIANSVGGQAKVVEETDTTMTIESGPFMMTRMMPPPEYRPIENLLGSKKITNIELLEGDKLVLSGEGLKIECSRLTENS